MAWWLVLIWAATGAFAVVLLSAMVWAYRQRRQAMRLLAAEPADPFSTDAYRQAEMLLSEDDFEFLKKQPGYAPEIGAHWKRERRRIFRMYLRELTTDFYRLHQMAREMVANAGAESAPLVGTLIRQQIAFSVALGILEGRLALHAMGIGRVDVRSLVDLVEAARGDLARFAPQLA